MSSRRSNSLVSLALLVGVSLCWAGAPAALAGDKIDFSAPSAPVAVPQLERENKEAAASSHSSSMLGPTPAMMDDPGLPQAGEVVIVTPPKKKDSRSWESDSLDNRNGTDNLDNADNDPYARPRPFTGTTNRWDMQRGWSPAPDNAFSIRRNEEGERSDGFRARMDSLSMPGSRDSLNADRSDWSSTGFDSDSAWSSSAFHHAFPNLDRMRSGQFVDPETKSLADPHSIGAQPASNPGDPSYGFATPPGMAEYSSQVNALRGKLPEENGIASPVFRSSETKRAAQTYSSGNSPTDFAPEAHGLAPARPAVLQFPKKPGDLMR